MDYGLTAIIGGNGAMERQLVPPQSLDSDVFAWSDFLRREPSCPYRCKGYDPRIASRRHKRRGSLSSSERAG
jgi:hypothetical protein